MQNPIWHTTLRQLFQTEREKERGVASLAIAANNSTSSLKSPSLSSKDCFSISIIESNRSIRINPSEDEHDLNEHCDSNIITDESDDNLKVIFTSGRKEEGEGEEDDDGKMIKEVVSNPAEAWLPITESREGNMYYCIFHLISSGIGVQSLSLPLAFTTLGWAWGIASLSMAFIWQLYTIWLLTQLHESSGYRYSRYIQLAMAAFGPKLGKLLALLPVMYLSGGTCVTLLITGGGTMHQLYHILCESGHICHTKSPTIVEWYLLFICLAIVVAQLPNLNSVAWVSLVSAITGKVYCTLIWVMSISNGRTSGTINSSSSKELKSEISVMDVLSAVGMVAFSFRGHNLVLEIQGTLPASLKNPTHKTMWTGVKISYALTAMCLFPIAVAGHWAYGTLMLGTGMLNTFAQLNMNRGSKLKLAIVYFFLIVNILCSFQVYAMPVFDNFELRYVSVKKKPCNWWLRAGLRIFFGGLVFVIAVALPFLPLLAPLIGGIALPVTYAYPCFMWISIKKPTKFCAMWFFNLVLGSLGILLSVVLIIAAIYHLVTKGLSAHFFHPQP